MSFTMGDSVQKIGGGPRMTVLAVNGDEITCVLKHSPQRHTISVWRLITSMNFQYPTSLIHFVSLRLS